MASSEASTRTQAAMARDDVLPRLSWQAQVAAVWGVAGGAAAGALVAALVLLGRIHAVGMAPITLLLALTCGALGLLHGVVLGYIGRPHGARHPARRRDHVLAFLTAGAALAASALLALWLVLSAVLLRSGWTWGAPAFVAGAIVTVAIGVWATLLGWRSLERAYADWADHRLGAGLLAGSFLTLCAVFLALRPAIPGTQLQLAAPGWLIVAALATIWIAAPAVVLALRIGRSSDRK